MAVALAPLAAGAVALRAGAARLEARVPPGWELDEVVDPPGDPAAGTPETIRAALRAGGLPAAARGARRVAILIPDATRVARSDLYLPALAEILAEAGVPDAGIAVILATGTHAAPGGARRRALLGSVADRFPVTQHDCRDPGALVSVGTTSLGNEVRLARTAVERDLVILTGRVTNHYFAGFTGGRKAVLPGIAGFDTIVRNHRRVLDAAGAVDPRVGNGRLADNPVHLEMTEAAALLPPPAFLVNTVVAADGDLLGLFAGPLAPTHERACARAEATGRVACGEPYDVVLASCGGAPADGLLMQALKTPVGWGAAVRPGGVLVWVAGMGPDGLPGFLRWLSLTATAELRAAAVADYDLRAHNAILLRQLGERCRVLLVSPLPAATVAALGFAPYADLEAALAAAAATVGPRARGLVVGSGNITYPG